MSRSGGEAGVFDRLRVERVTAVDDEIVRLEQAEQGSDRAPGGLAVRYHHPDSARGGQ